MTLRRTASQRPHFYNLSSGNWPSPVLQPKGEYLAALIRSYLDFLPRVNLEHDAGVDARAEILEEVSRLRELQSHLQTARLASGGYFEVEDGREIPYRLRDGKLEKT